MLKLPEINEPSGVRYGYYLIEPLDTNEVAGFIMPDDGEDQLGVGRIILSGEYFYSNAEQLDLEFTEGELVVYRLRGYMAVRCGDVEHHLVPHENVFMSLEEVQEDE